MKKFFALALASFAFVGSAQAESIVGVGMVLSQSQDGKILIEEFVPNGPAERSRSLVAGDQILEVKSLPDAEWAPAVDLAGTVAMIRGEVGTNVSLRVQPVSGNAPSEVTLTREIIEVGDGE